MTCSISLQTMLMALRLAKQTRMIKWGKQSAKDTINCLSWLAGENSIILAVRVCQWKLDSVVHQWCCWQGSSHQLGNLGSIQQCSCPVIELRVGEMFQKPAQGFLDGQVCMPGKVAGSHHMEGNMDPHEHPFMVHCQVTDRSELSIWGSLQGGTV